jgi:hypothetical protein
VDTCLHPWSAVRPAVCTPTHWTVHVQCLYICCYLSVNIPVLSYLLSRLLPHYHPLPPCVSVTDITDCVMSPAMCAISPRRVHHQHCLYVICHACVHNFSSSSACPVIPAVCITNAVMCIISLLSMSPISCDTCVLCVPPVLLMCHCLCCLHHQYYFVRYQSCRGTTSPALCTTGPSM